MTHNYRVLGDIADNLKEFDKPVELAFGGENTHEGGWQCNQKDIVNTVKLALNSQFKDGPMDETGRRKIYINEVQFSSDVAKKNIDIDLKHWLFVPEDKNHMYVTMLMKEDFFGWALSHYYNELIDRQLDDFVDFGTCVQKQLKGNVTRVSIDRISITQTAESIVDAVESSGFFIEHHEMSYKQMEAMPSWELKSVVDKRKKHYVLERYAYTPTQDLQQFKGQEITADSDDLTLCMTIAGGADPKEAPNAVYFIEEITVKQLEERYQEGWYQKVDNRWLGRGPVEQLLENQIAKNITANLRLKSLEWHARKIFQSANMAKKANLAIEARDGDVLEITPNGEYKPVDISSQGLGEYQAFDVMVADNGDRKVFNFESATGETMPSGTPFRLGLIQQNSVTKHYQKKQENFGAFLKRGYFESLVPKFKREVKPHTLTVAFSGEGNEQLQKAYITIKANKRVQKALRERQYLPFEEAYADVLDEIGREPYMAFEILKDAYKDIREHIDLVITGESQDIPEETASLTSLYTALAQQGDPAARAVLEMIFAKKGHDLTRLIGARSAQPQQPQQTSPQNQDRLASAPQPNTPNQIPV